MSIVPIQSKYFKSSLGIFEKVYSKFSSSDNKSSFISKKIVKLRVLLLLYSGVSSFLNKLCKVLLSSLSSQMWQSNNKKILKINVFLNFFMVFMWNSTCNQFHVGSVREGTSIEGIWGKSSNQEYLDLKLHELQLSKRVCVTQELSRPAGDQWRE